MPSQQTKEIPVVIITGFLGSGKTTVLNYVLKQPGMKSTAVIINEFGEIGIDHLLVEASTEQMVELNNGCICCTIRGDLADKLGSLAMWLDTGRIPPVERVIVETTGLADPAPIVHTLMTDEHLLNRYRLDGVVTVVDAIAGMSSFDRFPEALKQVAIADRLILSKRDLVQELSDWKTYSNLTARIRRINPRVEIHETRNGAIDPKLMHCRSTDDPEHTFRDFDDWLSAAAEYSTTNSSHGHHDGNAHTHDDGDIKSFVIELKHPVNSEQFNAFLQALAIEFGEYILRVKGILHVESVPDQPAIIHGVQHVFFPVSWLDRWPDEERSSKIVFITQGLDSKQIKGRFNEHYS